MDTIQTMNEKHSHGQASANARGGREYLPRWMASEIRHAIQVTPVVVLTGARQVGKSTLLRNERPFNEWRYVTLDDHDALSVARSDPAELWAGTQAIVIDEAQRAPELLLAIKKHVDEPSARVRFVLSGSANLLLLSAISETLAGRASYLRLGPLALGEVRGVPAPLLLAKLLGGELPAETSVEPLDPHPMMVRGLMPGLLGFDEAAAVRWWEGYVTTYLERDLRQLSQIESLADFRRVMEAVALRSGSVLNQTDIGRDVGVSQPTVHRYLNLLEASHVLERISGFAVSRTQRLSKRPKAYVFDAGGAAYLCGLHDVETVRRSRERGGLFEGLVLQELRAAAALLSPAARIHYWRTATGAEVDFVVEHGRALVPFEVKLTTSPGYGDVTRLKEFLSSYEEARAGVLVHAGGEVVRLGERIIAVPWTVLTGH